MSGGRISVPLAQAHEALVVRFEALLRDLRPLAARRPEGRVTGSMRVLAEGLLHDAQRFRPRARREVWPVAARSLGALALQLGQTRAGLEAFELVHTRWSARHKAFVWRTDTPLPVGRLRPELAGADAESGKAREALRGEIMRRLQARIEEAYEQGVRDAQTGIAPPAANA